MSETYQCNRERWQRLAVRPYPRKISGEPLSMSFDIMTTAFEFTFRHANGVDAPTEIFIPEVQYQRGFSVEVSDGTFELDNTNQTVYYEHTNARKNHTIRIGKK